MKKQQPTPKKAPSKKSSEVTDKGFYLKPSPKVTDKGFYLKPSTEVTDKGFSKSPTEKKKVATKQQEAFARATYADGMIPYPSASKKTKTASNKGYGQRRIDSMNEDIKKISPKNIEVIKYKTSSKKK